MLPISQEYELDVEANKQAGGTGYLSDSYYRKKQMPTLNAIKEYYTSFQSLRHILASKKAPKAWRSLANNTIDKISKRNYPSPDVSRPSRD